MIFRFFGYIIAGLPDLIIDRAALFLSWLLYSVLRFRRKLVVENITRAYGKKFSKKQIEHVARYCYYHFLLTIFEFLSAIKKPLVDNVKMIGLENFSNSLEKNQGAFVLCCHLGNWEAQGAAISRFICPTKVLVKKIGLKSLNKFIEDVREKNGFLSIIRKNKGDGARAILRALKEKNAVGYVLDQYRPTEPFVPFFGYPARTNTGLAQLVNKLKTPVVPAFILRKSYREHEVHILPELNLSQKESEDVIYSMTRIMNQALEAMIDHAPEQYFWFHRRWKGQESNKEINSKLNTN
ncbi:MAG: lysophospholipid acyltransferase family protein [Oligoflexales bacterium]|nr:lysophospholipid acyltransferase family protein [Oligoflexales bacterium]